LDNIIASAYNFGTEVLAKTIACPLENVKLLQQLRRTQPPYGSSIPLLDGWSLLNWIPEHCGVTALWRGNLANVIRALPIALLQHPSIFLPNEPLNESAYFVQSPFPSAEGNHIWWKERASSIVRSSLVGAAVLLFVHPFELARTRLALDIQTPHQFSGIFDCLGQIASRDGFLSLYKGYGVTLLGVILYRTICTIFYELIALQASKLSSTEGKALCFALVTTLAGMLTYPLDTIRRHQMMDNGSPDGRATYSSALDCMGQIVNKYGFSALFDGCFFHTLSCSVVSITLLCCQAIKKRM